MINEPQKIKKIIESLVKHYDKLDFYKESNEPMLKENEEENINIALDGIEQAEYALKRLFPRG